MASNIKNTKIIQNIRDITGLADYTDTIPKRLSDDIQLTIPVNGLNPQICDVVKRNSATNTTTGTIYTTPADKDFYLCSCFLAVIKDVTSTSTASWVSVTIGGTTVQINEITGISLTAQYDSMAIAFPIPIKLDRGTTITINNGTNVANIRAVGGITGFTFDPTIYTVNQ